MEKKIILLDGAVGTSLWAKAKNQVAVWRYNLEDPEIVKELHREYLEAGADVIQANTFGANRLTVKTTDYTVKEVVSTAVRLAREVVGDKAKVALSVGPLPALMEPYGDLTEEEVYELFDEQISAGVAEGPDMIILETFMDLAMLQVALRAASRHGLPILAMMAFTEAGKTMMGNSVKDFAEGVRDFPVTAIGLNCACGPDVELPVIAQFRQYTDLPLVFKPNAGKPVTDGEKTTGAEYSAEIFAADCIPALDSDILYLGGCCGSDPTYIRLLHEKLAVMGRH